MSLIAFCRDWYQGVRLAKGLKTYVSKVETKLLAKPFSAAIQLSVRLVSRGKSSTGVSESSI